MAKARDIRIQYRNRMDGREMGLWTSDRPTWAFVDMLRRCSIKSDNVISFKVQGELKDPKLIDKLLEKEGQDGKNPTSAHDVRHTQEKML